MQLHTVLLMSGAWTQALQLLAALSLLILLMNLVISSSPVCSEPA